MGLSLANLIGRLPGGLAQGIIWGIMAIGVYLTFRVLKVSDLSVDGTFASGGCVTVMLIINGINPLLALLAAALAGMAGGLVTGLLHTKCKIPAVLAGILTQYGLYSINLRIMNMSANTACNPDRNVLLLSLRNVPKAILVALVFALVIIAVLYWFFGTEAGSAIRATGSNVSISNALGINIDTAKITAIALSNGIVALAGGLMAQYQGFADVKMGQGAIVIGLAAIIIGEVISSFIFGKKPLQFYTRLLMVIVGGIIYYFIMIIVLWLRFDSNDLKLCTAIIVALFLSLPNLTKRKAVY